MPDSYCYKNISLHIKKYRSYFSASFCSNWPMMRPLSIGESLWKSWSSKCSSGSDGKAWYSDSSAIWRLKLAGIHRSEDSIHQHLKIHLFLQFYQKKDLYPLDFQLLIAAGEIPVYSDNSFCESFFSRNNAKIRWLIVIVYSFIRY